MSVRSTDVLPAIAAILIASVPCITTSAAAAEQGVRISYADLNLTTTAGVSALYARIHGAAERYCEPARAVTGSRVSASYGRCVQDAIDMTVHKLNVPALTSLHEQRAGAGSRS